MKAMILIPLFALTAAGCGVIRSPQARLMRLYTTPCAAQAAGNFATCREVASRFTDAEIFGIGTGAK